MASAKRRQEERTEFNESMSDEAEQFTLRDDVEEPDDYDDDDDVIYDQVSMPRDADSMYDVIGRAPPTSGQMLRSHVTDVYGPIALVQ